MITPALPLLQFHSSACLSLIRWLLFIAVIIDEHHRRVQRRVKHWQRKMRLFCRGWLIRHGWLEPDPVRPCRAWNRTPPHIEEEVVRLHVEQPHLGAGQLRWLAERVLGFTAARETIRQILIRRRDLVMELEAERRKQRRRRIEVKGPRKLWGADLTLVWVLAIVPVWIIGIVDYHGSRLVAFEAIEGWPNAAEVAGAIERAVREHGAPERILTDRAPLFRAPAVQAVLEEHGIEHSRIRPCHAWTNGRIERIFKTFKQTVFEHAGLWLFKSRAQVDRFCAHFMLFYNRDRPHESFGGRTPDEVYFGRQKTKRAFGRVSYFDEGLYWYRFG